MDKFKIVFCAMIAEMDLVVISLINTYFIGNDVGAVGVAAYEIVMPCMLLMCAFVSLGYNGMQTVCSKDYGAKDFEAFERHKNAGYSWMMLVILVLTLALAVFRAPMLDVLGANDGGAEMAALSNECYTAVLFFFFFQGLFCAASCMLFFEERRRLVTANIILYACIFLSDLLISRFCPSIGNYIFAGVIGNVVADFYIFVCCFARDKNSISAFKAIRLKLSDVKEIFFAGLPNFMEYIFVALLFWAENLYILYRFSESVVAGLAIFEAVENVPELLCEGFCFLAINTFGTAVGRLRAASSAEEKQICRSELKKNTKDITLLGVVGAICTSVVILILAYPVSNGFLSEGSDAIAVHSAGLITTAYGISFAFYILNNELVCYYKVVGTYHLAHIIFFVEALAFPLAAKVLLGELFGLTGFCFAGIAGEVLAFLLNLCFIRKASGKIMNIT